MMKNRVLYTLLITLILSGCSAPQKKETFVELIEHCRASDIEGRTNLYSQKSLAWNLGNILSKTDNDKSLSIARNRINTCLEPEVIESYEFSTQGGNPRLKLNYLSAENRKMYIYFTFAQESGKWVIAHTEQGVFNLAQ